MVGEPGRTERESPAPGLDRSGDGRTPVPSPGSGSFITDAPEVGEGRAIDFHTTPSALRLRDPDIGAGDLPELLQGGEVS